VQPNTKFRRASDTVVANFDDAFISANGTYYYLRDHLSPRVTTDANGNVIGQQGHFPFGEQWYASNSTTKWQFTSYERDSETGNDCRGPRRALTQWGLRVGVVYAQARYHINRLGRFSSPDPLAGDTSDPQSLNRYSYVRNMPIDLVDPSGADPCPRGFAQDQRPDKPRAAEGSGSGDGPSDSTDDDGAPPPQGYGTCGGPPWAYLFGQPDGGGVSLDGAPLDSSLIGAFIGDGESTDLIDYSDSYSGSWGFVSPDDGDGPGEWQPDVSGGLPFLIGSDMMMLGGGGGAGRRGSAQTTLKLVLTVDCLDGNGRWRDYSLIDSATN
jgi:RHS repeat-associated protein